MTNTPDRRKFLINGMAAASAGVAARCLSATAMVMPGGAQVRRPIAIDDPRLPEGLTVDYAPLHHEIIDYDNYSLDSMPRLRFRGPRFDPRTADRGKRKSRKSLTPTSLKVVPHGRAITKSFCAL